MSWIIILIAVSVSVDAMAVAASYATHPRFGLAESLRLTAAFGLAQAVMAGAGAAIGARGEMLFSGVMPWLAAAALVLVGGKMIREALEEEEDEQRRPLTWSVLLLLTVATSIDSLAVGVTIPLLELPLLLTIVTIGLTTALFTFAGARLGRVMSGILRERAPAAGGVVLILLAGKIIYEHLGGS
jgi:manganese efflux pump family protein